MSYSVGWFSTGRDEAARRLLLELHERMVSGVIPARIGYVFSNREPGESGQSDAFFRLVESLGLKLVFFPSRSFQPEMRRTGRGDPAVMRDWRRAYDEQVAKRLPPGRTDLVLLAGYMLIMGDRLCGRLPIVNLHPSAPGGPKGTWQEVIWELIRKEEKTAGVMMHRVTEILDEGPVITFCTFPIRGGPFDDLWKEAGEQQKLRSPERMIPRKGEGNPLFQQIRSQGLRREIPLLIYTIKALAEGKIRLGPSGMTNEHGGPFAPVCLNEPIEAFLAKGASETGRGEPFQEEF